MFGLAALGAMLAGISKGGFGGSLGFAGSAILAVVVEPGVALALMLPVLMAIDMAAVRAYWGRWDDWSYHWCGQQQLHRFYCAVRGFLRRAHGC